MIVIIAFLWLYVFDQLNVLYMIKCFNTLLVFESKRTQSAMTALLEMFK